MMKKYRQVIRDSQGRNDIVWFGSYGVNPDGTAKFANENHTSYVDKQEGIKSSLIQKLSIIKGELWYNMNYGLPLFEKWRTKGMLDASVIDIVLNEEEVQEILSFESYTSGDKYIVNLIVLTKFGTIDISI